MSEYGQAPNPWQSEIVVCKDGLTLNIDALTQGSSLQGSATNLQNFEVALEGGYRRIYGYTKYDSTVVPGLTNAPVLGVKAALSGVFAARLNSGSTSNDIYFGSGAGWSKINTSTRPGAVAHVRMITYAISAPVVVGCDGVNPAFKYDGTTYTLLNGTDAPANPKYAEMFNSSLVLAGMSASPMSIIITAPNTDTDFQAADGAIEINVGDVVVGIRNFRSTLYVFCLNRIFKVVTDSTTTYALQLVTSQIGCISPDSIQEIGGDLIYLAPDGFRSVAGTFNIDDVDLSLQSRPIQPLIRNNLLDDLQNVNVVSCTVKKKSQYRAFFYDSTVPQSAAQGIIGKVEQGQYLSGYNATFVKYSWSTTLGIQPYCIDSYWENNQELVVHGDPANGYVYEQESGNDFDGTPIVALFTSPYLTFKDASLRKVMQKATIYTEAEGSNTVNLNVNFDFNNTGILQPPTVSFNFGSGFSLYGSARYGTAVYSAIQFPVFKQNLNGSGFVAQFQFYTSGGAPYRIDSFQIIYGLKGRR